MKRSNICFLLVAVLYLYSCSTTKNKSEVAVQNAPSKKSFGEPVSLDLEAKNAKTNQSMSFESNTVNCFSKEVFASNQRDCTNEGQNWVCGCNSISYPNECEAKKAGVKTFRRGKCLKEAKDI